MDAEHRKRAHGEITRRRTFAIISHPDAGKTTITEKLLLFGGAIQLAGAVKQRKAQRSARSDWISVEKERGISVSTSVMSFEHNGVALNLLDTPGHNDFSEDTYRTLTAVDGVLMVIDASKGVEAQTEKLLEVCRRQRTPVITFMNKLDLGAREPLDLLEEIEKKLGMASTPFTWPIGSGPHFKGVYDLRKKQLCFYQAAARGRANERELVDDLGGAHVDELLGSDAQILRDEVELIEAAADKWDPVLFGRGQLTPVFFGSALNNFGVRELLDTFCELSPPPQPRATADRLVEPEEEKFSGFVFKIQANMDPRHRDRMAFIRVCSGRFARGMKLHHVRANKPMIVRNAMTFLGRDRGLVDEAWPGDIIGIPNHGTIRIADTFTEGEALEFTALPKFAPELFREAQLRDPMKQKQLAKGLKQLCDEGAAQLFRPVIGARWIVGALGVLQFEVIEARLRDEYRVDCVFGGTSYRFCRWVRFSDDSSPAVFEHKYAQDLFRDERDNLCLLTETRFRSDYIAEKNPDIELTTTMELAG
jgi:peptide chain release factor 3